MGRPRPYYISTRIRLDGTKSYGWKCRYCGAFEKSIWDYRYSALTSVRWHTAYAHVWSVSGVPAGVPRTVPTHGGWPRDSSWIRDVVESAIVQNQVAKT